MDIRVTEITRTFTDHTLEKLREAKASGIKKVHFTINSIGGHHDSVFKIIDFLKKEGFKTSCLVNRAASAAALLAISCDRRTIKRKGKILLHAVMLTIPVTAIDKDGRLPLQSWRWSKKRQAQTENLLLLRTKLGSKFLKHIMRPGNNAAFDANASLELRLVDEIEK